MTGGGRDFQPDPDLPATQTGTMLQRELAIGEMVAGRFRIIRMLGMGGMGLVYHAHDTELDVDVALKLLRPELASRPDAFERFRQELLLARQVSSAHVVRIHDLVRHDQAWLISMDYVAGKTLERLLTEQPRFTPERALDITRQLALGLAAAHKRNVIHRDLKPANVMVDEDGEARITDFGVARSAGETGITGSGVVIGTPEYLSPEQARAEPLDARSDLYALGLILFEMLTGTLPFRGGTPAEMLVQRIVRDPPSADTIQADLPPFAVKLCAWLLELRVTRRIASAEAVVQAIDSGTLKGMPKREWTNKRSALLAGLIALVIAAGYAWLRQTAPTPDAATTQTASSTALDLLPMPWASDAGADNQALAAGIGHFLAAQLSEAPGLRSADPLRVDRALRELGYDASAADRQHQRVLQVMHAQRGLEGEIRGSADKGWTLMLRLVDAESATPRWSAQEVASSEQVLPAALASLFAKLDRQLGHDLSSIPWPDAGQLRAIGTASDAGSASLTTDAARELAQRFHNPELWWQLMRRFDRSGRSSEAADLAGSARDDLAKESSRAAQRTTAYALLLLGEPDASAKLLAPLVDSARDDHPARLMLARSSADLGNLGEAITQLRALVAEDPRNVDAWYALGRYSIQAGDAKSAVDEYLVRAEVLANRLNDPVLRADVSHAYGVGYRRLGQMDAAAEKLRSAVSQRESLGDQRGQAASLRNLSTVLSMQGRFDEAGTALDQARTITEALGDSRALGDLANAKGALAEEQGDYRAALDAYRDSLRLRQTLGDNRAVGESLNNVGFAYYQLGEFDNAQTYWQQSAATYQGIDDRQGLVHAKQSQALAEIARGDWKSARSLLDESLGTAESLQMAEERTVSLANLAELDRLEGRMDSADKEAAKALEEFAQRKDQRGVVEMRLLLAAIAGDLGDWAAAQEELGKLDVDSASEQASTLRWRLAEIQYGSGHLDAALKAVDEAIPKSVDARSHADELQARLLKVRILAGMKRDREARTELNVVKQGLVRYASVPLRLRLAETSLLLGGPQATADYREARILLARLPAYGHAFVIHQLGARAGQANSDSGRQAQSMAREAFEALLKQVPEARRATLHTWAKSVGIEEAPAP